MKSVESNNYEIDSFILRIPADKVSNVSGILNGIELIKTEIFDISTGQRVKKKESEKVIKTHRTAEADIPTDYEFKAYYNNSKKIVEYFYTIKVTSKHLKERYFEGITKENINIVYQSLMSQEIIFVEYEDFLNSFIADVDFKKDHYNNHYIDFFKKVEQANPPSKNKKKLLEKFRSKNNQGFQFNSRQKASSALPYIKYYNKHLQTKVSGKKGMKEFYEQYLQHQNIKTENLYRIEYTIKGKEMFERFGLNGNNILNDVLRIPDEIKQGIAKDIFTTYTETLKPIRKVSAKLTAKQKTALMIKDLSIKLGMSLNQIEAYVKDYNLRYESEKTLLNDIKILDFGTNENILNEQLAKNNYLEDLMKEIGIL